MKQVLILMSLLSWNLKADEKISFNKQVRPILADRCYHCHGPDGNEIKGKLQLHTFELATHERVYKSKSGKERRRDAAIIPGKPEESLVWERLITDDEDEIMPPLDSVAKQLTKEEKEIIRKWIEQGANYEKHWAFVPPQKKMVKVNDNNWCKNDIDSYVLKQLEELNLSPNPEASKEVLIRRLSLDLRGTPPSLEELDEFLADEKPDAYERLLLEVIKGDQWLFVSRDEIEASWRWCDALLDAWADKKVGTKSYSAGSWGPSKAEILIESDNRSWHEE